MKESIFTSGLQHPKIQHYIAPGDTVVKSGDGRGDVAARGGIIAFEIEGVGDWDAYSLMLII